MSPIKKKNNRFFVAKIGRPHGLLGALRGFVVDGEHDFVGQLNSFVVEGLSYELEFLKQMPRHFIFKLVGIDTFEAALFFRGKSVFTTQKALLNYKKNLEKSSLKRGVYLAQEFLGESIFAEENGECLGEIVDYYDKAGAEGIFEIRLKNKTLILVPRDEDCLYRVGKEIFLRGKERFLV